MKTVSFYSYKGGVGRSLALAYTAKYLARINFRVCILDIDLEAPGIIYKFQEEPEPQRNGVVDYIYACIKENQVPQNIADYFYTYQENKYGFIKVMNAGKGINTKEYWDKLSQIDWGEMFFSYNNEGLYLFENLKGQIQKQVNPDYLFIDSRSGVTVMSKICNSVLPDTVVMLLANNNENYNGSRIMYNHIAYSEDYKVKKEKTEIICAITRIPKPENEVDSHKELDIINKFIEKIDNPFLKKTSVVVIHSDRFVEYEESSVFQDTQHNERPIIGDYYQLITKIVDREMLEMRKSLIINEPKYNIVSINLQGMIEKELKILRGDTSYIKFRVNLEKNIVENPNSSQIRYQLALCERYDGNIIESVAGLSSSINSGREDDEWSINAHYWRGLIFLYDLNNYKDSIIDLQRVYTSNPSFNPHVLYYLAVCFLCLEQFDDALEHISNYTSENKSDISAILLRAAINEGKMKYHAKRGEEALVERSEIIADYDKVIEIKPNYDIVYYNRGIFYDYIGDKQKALNDFNKAIEINPSDDSAYNNRGSLYYELGEIEKALSDYNKALEINPDSKRAQKNRELLFSKIKKSNKS